MNIKPFFIKLIIYVLNCLCKKQLLLFITYFIIVGVLIKVIKLNFPRLTRAKKTKQLPFHERTIQILFFLSLCYNFIGYRQKILNQCTSTILN
jgi:uncharacterized metal-binding protein